MLSPCLALGEEPGLLPVGRADSTAAPPAALFLLLPFASLLGCVPVRLSGGALPPSARLPPVHLQVPLPGVVPQVALLVWHSGPLTIRCWAVPVSLKN